MSCRPEGCGGPARRRHSRTRLRGTMGGTSTFEGICPLSLLLSQKQQCCGWGGRGTGGSAPTPGRHVLVPRPLPPLPPRHIPAGADPPLSTWGVGRRGDGGVGRDELVPPSPCLRPWFWGLLPKPFLTCASGLHGRGGPPPPLPGALHTRGKGSGRAWLPSAFALPWRGVLEKAPLRTSRASDFHWGLSRGAGGPAHLSGCSPGCRDP